ncbi:MAG TPA: zinc-binding dehydrogenase [Jiangellaceae bacterium]
MHAIRQYEFGPAEKLRYEDVEDPHPGPGQVRISVRAAGVHLIDTVIRQGGAAGAYGRPEFPMTPGREVAGIVDELGDGVDTDWLGARVVTHLGPASGGYAELAVSDVASVHALLDDVGFDTSVAMIGTGRTTMGILRFAQLTRDDIVLVTSAAGGIGGLVVQAGRNLGATVVGVAGGARKVERVRALGAEVAADYNDPDWTARVREELDGREITVVLDGVGGALGRGALELLGPGGTLVMFGWASGTATHVTTDDLVDGGLTVTWVLGPAMRRWPPIRTLEKDALAELAAGRLVPDVQSFPLKDAAAAHAALETRATLGKVVLVP